MPEQPEFTTYQGWQTVPSRLMAATSLAALEFPRTPTGQPHSAVDAFDWRGKPARIDLYDAALCPPTSASPKQLAAAGSRTGSRTCVDCGARSQRRLVADHEGRPLCPVCHQIIQLRRAQQDAAERRTGAVKWARRVLAKDDAAVVQVDVTNPGRTPAGALRRDVAARVWAVDLAGKSLVDVPIGLVRPGSKFAILDVVPQDEAAPLVHTALLNRPLIVWDKTQYRALREAAPHPDWPQCRLDYGGPNDQVVAVRSSSMQWRGEINERRNLVQSIPPGTPGRLLLHLQRIAADETQPLTERTRGAE